METAIHADSSVLTAFNQIKQTKVSQSNEQNEDLKRLSGDRGFKTLQKVLDAHIEALQKMQGMIDKSDSVESIGFKYLACQVAVERLRIIRDLPQSLIEAEKHGIK